MTDVSASTCACARVGMCVYMLILQVCVFIWWGRGEGEEKGEGGV